MQNIIALGLVFFFAIRLFGALPALLGLLLLAFDPFSIALSRLLHPDALLSTFKLLSLVAFMSYLYRGRRRFDLVVSASGKNTHQR